MFESFSWRYFCIGDSIVIFLALGKKKEQNEKEMEREKREKQKQYERYIDPENK